MREEICYGSEKPMGYKPRVVDERIASLLNLFGAIEVAGTKWCGKTWSASAFGESVVHIDDKQVRDLVSADPSLALEGANPHVIDEWQEVPSIWDAARRAVDASGSEKGLYLLTGSSTPAKNEVIHSGAGRIARVRMHTMSLWESGESSGAVSLAGLFDGSFRAGASSGMGLRPLSQVICRGGWPALIGAEFEPAAETVSQYLDALFEISVPKKGGNAHTAKRIAASLARNVATSATLETIAADSLDDSSAGFSRETVAFYLDLFRELYFIDELYGWDAPVRAKSRVRTKPKRYFADPSIPVQLLGMNPSRLLSDAQTFGLLFESLCIHDLRVYASALKDAPADPLRYYQDADGLEVDAIIELRDGRWAGIEVKLGEDKVSDGIACLDRLRKKVRSNSAARNKEPAFMAVVTANSPFERYDRESNVYVFPITSLCP